MAQNTENVKQQRFTTLAERRTERVLDSLRLLGQCSNKRSYDYTDEQANKIFREIRNCLRQTEQKFKEGSVKTTFRL